MTADAPPAIALAASFTLDQIAAKAAELTAPTGREVRVAPYGQLIEPMLDPDSVLLTNTGVNVVLVRVEDLRAAGGQGGTDTDMVDELLTALTAAPSRSAATWLVVLTPPSPRALEDLAMRDWLTSADKRIADAVDQLPGVHLVELAELAEHYDVADVHDDYADRLAHLPYTDEFSDALADKLVRLAATTWRKPRKVVVLDCDNTLWAGVCGEDGPCGVTIGAGHRRVQEFLIEQRSGGKLLCLCSRNNEDDVRAVFAQHPQILLTLKDITAYRIGWGSKADYLRELSAELGLALDSFIFVDDDPVECASVRAELPEVAVVEVDRDGGRAWRQLAREPAFDQLSVTEEDRLRADWYATESERRSLRESTSDYEEFLARCGIEVSLDPLDDRALERAAQLTSRTTQFTLTGTARTVSELRAFLGRGGLGRVVRVRDSFGDYGVVGLVLAQADGEVLDVPDFLLSCRMLNRRVDTAVLDQLRTEARSAGCDIVRLHYRPTPRNAPARQFLERAAGTPIAADDPSGTVAIAV